MVVAADGSQVDRIQPSGSISKPVVEMPASFRGPIQFGWVSSSIAGEKQCLVDRIDSLATLPPDWDTYGSPPIQPTAVVAVRYLLEESQVLGLPLPQVVPVPGGGLQLEWNLEGRALEMEVGARGELAYLFVDETHDVEEENRLPSYLLDEVADTMTRLLQRQ